MLARTNLNLTRQTLVRCFSTKWPKNSTNTVLNIVPQGHTKIVERFGKMLAVEDPGWFFAIPLVDKIKFLDMREITIEIDPQRTITKDNVHVDVSGNIFIIFNDPQKACYGAANPVYSVQQHVQSAMRAAIGKMELDELLHNRNQLNDEIKVALQTAAGDWGMEVKRYELTEISPDHHITIAMDKQAAAERERREMILGAEGKKRADVLESEGHLIRVKNEAEASRQKSILEAEGEAKAITTKALAMSESIQTIADTMSSVPGATEAARLKMAEEYIGMYSEMGRESNTLFFNNGNPADINSLFAQVAATVKNVPEVPTKVNSTTSRSKVLYSGGRGARGNHS